jgi:hypothetical protein
LGVEQLKKHPFFYGVDWTAIRNIEAPFIPRLRSITDTSYFPTDELDQVPDEPVGGDTTEAHKELAFLGYVALEVLRGFDRHLDSKADVFPTAIHSRGSPFPPTLFDSPKDAFSYLRSTRGPSASLSLPGTCALVPQRNGR